MEATAGTIARDVKVTSLVGFAHFCSHFFQIVLPPLFPLLKDYWQVSYTELGLTMFLMFGASGLMQTPAGFLVDRFGARQMLAAGLAVQVAAIGLVAVVPSFWMVLVLLTIAGIGNSVYHPADFSILAGVTPGRLARAYSVHSLAGILGWALAPVVMLALTAIMSWQAALGFVSICGLVVALLVAAQKALLSVPQVPKPSGKAAAAPGAASLLLSAPILACFAYFTMLSVSLTGLQTFLPATLIALYGLEVTAGSAGLATYMVANAVGNIAGGFWADGSTEHERNVGIGLGLAALALLAVGLFPLELHAMMAAIAFAGFVSGATLPSRDLLVRLAAPDGATGKVFGFVYSGLDLGAAVAPLMLGLLLDHDLPRMVMVVCAASLGLTILSTTVLARVRR